MCRQSTFVKKLLSCQVSYIFPTTLTLIGRIHGALDIKLWTLIFCTGQKIVTQIACGQAFSMVVLETGEVINYGQKIWYQQSGIL